MVWKFILWKSTKLPNVAGTFCFHVVQKKNPKMWNFMVYQLSKTKFQKFWNFVFFANFSVKNIENFPKNKIPKILELIFCKFLKKRIIFQKIKFQNFWNFIFIRKKNGFLDPEF